ncbi:MAG: cob(I)yrinic acid a,c-diamide adenosyltransferase [Bacteriovoracaceae bacterium]
MKKSKIYTKTGDQGQTSILSGDRVLKSDERIELYGELDELNSFIGHALSFEEGKFQNIKTTLISVQNDIFQMGSRAACPICQREKYGLTEISKEKVEALETEIDRLDHELDELKNFILPGGNSFASSLHICRTVTRRVERRAIKLHSELDDYFGDVELKFLNRLSDYLFVASRFVNAKLGIQETIWKSNS